MRDDSKNYYFGDYVVPLVIIKSDVNGNNIEIIDFLGTGFFIGDEGYLLSAKHVISSELLIKTKEPNHLVAFTRTIKNNKEVWQPVQIVSIEDGPNNWDISIAKVNHKPKRFFNLNEDSNASGWEDLHSFGYPDHLKYLNDFSVDKIYQFNNQFLKGYVVRRIEPSIKPTLYGIEPIYILSYPIPKGMSGSPIFKTGLLHPLVGICLRSFDLSTTLYEMQINEQEESKHIESVKRIIEYGVGIRIFELKDWTIKIANQRKLSQLF